MAKLRYDHVVDAMAALQRYMDSSADEVNTLALLDDVTRSISALAMIEKNIEHKRLGAPLRSDSDVLSAVEEVEGKLEEMKEKTRFVEEFMREYREELIAVKEAFGKLQDLSTFVQTVRSIDRQLQGVRHRTQVI